MPLAFATSYHRRVPLHIYKSLNRKPCRR